MHTVGTHLQGAQCCVPGILEDGDRIMLLLHRYTGNPIACVPVHVRSCTWSAHTDARYTTSSEATTAMSDDFLIRIGPPRNGGAPRTFSTATRP